MRSAVFLLAAALAVPAMADYSQHPRAAELLQRLARDENFSDADLAAVRGALGAAEQIPALIEAEQKAAERTETWTTYAQKRVDPQRIERGLAFMDEFRPWLIRAENEYGVPAAVIAGIVGLETHYGRVTGGARVLDALTTQGFEHPTRSRFFFDELVQFFALCREIGFVPTEIKGSYAGAMGWAQFMPSNYRRLALDYDGDGRRDLWSAPDAIGSIARYLVQYDANRTWHRGEPLAVPARLTRPLPDGFPVNKKVVTHTAASLRALGVETNVNLPPDTPVGLAELTLDQGVEHWVALHNFYSVMSYNPRVYYAMTVTQLALSMSQLDAERARGE
ncbi:MAG TPA: lytic murein transglycosylase [Nevskiaceae bacterium]|nr:lytic murein transglycosylase [Nevskiaceae bacterium]